MKFIKSTSLQQSICNVLISGILGFSAFNVSAQTGSLEISDGETFVTLTWPDNRPLFSSPDLENYTLVEGATSPYKFDLEGEDRFFFRLGINPNIPEITEISSLVEGSTVGTEFIPVQGIVGLDYLGVQGLIVTVNGTPAEISTVGGIQRFTVPEQQLSVGLNQISVVFSSNQGVLETRNLTINYQPVIANNVIILGDYAYTAGGAQGGGLVVHLETRERTQITVNGNGLSIDDVATDGTFLFTMDEGNDTLSVFSLDDPANPQLVSGPVSTTSSFFSGVSAANGRVAVSGGTSRLIVRDYDTTSGELGEVITNLDLGLGQPDVLLSPDGNLAYTSTDFSSVIGGFSFGLTTVDLNSSSSSTTATTTQLGISNIPDLGLNNGGQVPANFPLESALLDDNLMITSINDLAIVSLDGMTLEGSVNVGFFTVNVDAYGDTAFVVGSNNGVPSLAEIDFSKTDNPRVISTSTFTSNGLFTGVAVNENHVVIAANAGGLRIIDRN